MAKKKVNKAQLIKETVYLKEFFLFALICQIHHELLPGIQSASCHLTVFIAQFCYFRIAHADIKVGIGLQGVGSQ